MKLCSQVYSISSKTTVHKCHSCRVKFSLGSLTSKVCFNKYVHKIVLNCVQVENKKNMDNSCRVTIIVFPYMKSEERKHCCSIFYIMVNTHLFLWVSTLASDMHSCIHYCGMRSFSIFVLTSKDESLPPRPLKSFMWGNLEQQFFLSNGD